MTEIGNIFDVNYRSGNDSGHGSNVGMTIPYRQLVETFIRLNNVRSVVDVGCGDWQFSYLIPWEYYGVNYLGLDISEFIVEKNNRLFGNAHREFKTLKQASDMPGLGRFDLVLCKDALQHMPNVTINEFLDAFEGGARYSLVTNDVYPTNGFNEDIELGGYRAVDIRQPPFQRASTVIAEYAIVQEERVFVKHVHLLPGKRG